jgi:hypothetical protein
MSADLTTTASGGRSAGSEGVTVGSKGNGNLGEPDPVPMPADPLPETLNYVTVCSVLIFLLCPYKFRFCSVHLLCVPTEQIVAGQTWAATPGGHLRAFERADRRVARSTRRTPNPG